MRITGLSFQIYVGLIILLAVLGAANTLLPQGHIVFQSMLRGREYLLVAVRRTADEKASWHDFG